MAQIDVSELLLDPDFINPVTLVHRKSVVNSHGENQLVETCEDTVGSVQPASGKVIQRLPDSLRVANVSSFWIKAGIISDSTCQYPDLISFKGKRYAVQTVDDWSNWGGGWMRGTCVAERLGG